ncbi:MAG TPA: hypothetical protein VKT20_10715 [Candidatus Dormibacteraeota bacterium]|nr:hypothetical protein [Candidatus Dormibacteraeota bacterium]
MEERSEEQILSRLLDLENGGQAERRVHLEDQTYISLIHDPDTGRGYVLRHGVDETEGAEVPEGAEFYEYPTPQLAEQAFDQLVSETAAEGQAVEDDSTDDEGDFETGGAEIRDLYSDEDTDPLVETENLSEDDEEPPNTIDS